MKHTIRFSGTAWVRFFFAMAFLFTMATTGQGGDICPTCNCAAPPLGCMACYAAVIQGGSCDCSECPCPDCTACTAPECGNLCECGDCPGNCKGEEQCSGCPACGTCSCSSACVDEDDSGFCDVCFKKFTCGECGENPCNCPCPVCHKKNGSCDCSFCPSCGKNTEFCSGEACKDRYNNDHPDGDLSFDEWLAMERFHNAKYGGTYEEFLAWLANYEGNYDDFAAVMKQLGKNDMPSLSEFILMIESTIDPINALTGELYFSEADIAVPAPGIPLVFERHYSSTEGWRHSYAWEFKAFQDKHLSPRTVHVLGDYGTWSGLQARVFTNSVEVAEDLKHMVVQTGEGREYRFEESEAEPGVFRAEALDWEVTVEPRVENGETNGCRYVQHRPGGIRHAFADNQLESIEDGWGNRIDLTYASNSLLVAHSSGVSLLLEHEGDLKRPTKAWVSGDLYVDYAYDDARRLTNAVRHVSGETFEFTYQYDETGAMTNKTNPRADEYRFTHFSAHTNAGYWAQNASGYSYTDMEEFDRTTTLEIGDGWYKHRVEAHWGYDSSGWEDYGAGESGSAEEVYRWSDVVYDYGNGLEKKYRYEAEDGLLREMFGPYTNATGVVTNRGMFYTYAGKNLATEKTFDSTLGEFYIAHRQYDTNNHVTAAGVSYNSTNPVWQAHIAYDPVWQLPAAVTNAEGHWTTTIYTNGLPLSAKAFWSDTQSFDTHFAYYTNGLVKAITNANEHATCMEYDANGNLLLVQPPAGPQVATVFNNLGHMERSEVLAESGASTGRITEFDVTAKGWVESITHPDGVQETFLFDKAGNVTNAADRAGRQIDFTYAPTKKLTSVTRYLSEGGTNTPVTVAYDFDKMFNGLRITEPRGRYVESYQLDLQDRVTSVTNIEGQAMSIDYGVADFVKRIDRFDGTSITNTFDNVGRKESVAYRTAGGSPLATIDYSYYADGELKVVSDGTSAVTNGYDWLNRLVAVTSSVPSVSSVVNYSHDPVGNVTNATISLAGFAPLRETSYSYDAAERLKGISTTEGTESQSFMHVYNPENGMVESISNTVSGITCSYEFDLMDRATNITYRAGDGTLIRSLDYEYDAVSMITRKTIVDDASSFVQHSYVYDSLDRLVYESTSTNGHSLFDIRYSHDLAGNRLSKTLNSSTIINYQLGSGNRLASASTSAASNSLFITGTANEQIGTDPRWGELWVTNWTSGASAIPSVNGNSFFAEIAAVAGQTNTVHAAIRDQAGNMGYAVKDYWVESSAGGTTASSSYEFDAAGCLTNLNGIALDWDERYRLTSVSSATSAVSYTYDVLGRRASRIETSNSNPQTTNCTYFVYNGHQVVADLDENGDLLRSYVWGTGIDNLLCFTDHTTSNTYYAIKDHQNSVIAFTDASGNVVESYEYSAYGETKVFNAGGTEISESALENRYCFQGREYDSTTGLYYFRARWYDPDAGRWLSKDPIGIEGGLNLYVFCENNPVNFVDPEGENWRALVVAVGQYLGEELPERYDEFYEGGKQLAKKAIPVSKKYVREMRHLSSKKAFMAKQFAKNAAKYGLGILMLVMEPTALGDATMQEQMFWVTPITLGDGTTFMWWSDDYGFNTMLSSLHDQCGGE